MTRRRENILLAVWVVTLMVFVALFTAYHLSIRHTKPVFVAPAIWSIPHTGGEPRIEFNI